MSNPSEDAEVSQALLTNRTMDIAVALIFMALAALFMFDCVRIGFGWSEGQGPASGFFPFYISLFMTLASLANLQRAVTRTEPDGDEVFVTRKGMMRVLSVLVPTAAYVLAIQYLGIYVSSAIFITLFMIAARTPVWRAGLVGFGTALALFMMFERWFLVPLPKGPIEAMLGF
jgi:putative tricarboxylic transport membrane protein